jgi:thymidine phosphorylase
MSGRAGSIAEGKARLQSAIDSGAGLAKFREFVANQGGDPRFIDDPALLPEAPVQQDLVAQTTGYVTAIDAEIIGLAAVEIGAGRKYKGDAIDPAVGFVLHAKLGQLVEKGQPLATIHARDTDSAVAIEPRLRLAFAIQEQPPALQSVILEIIS